MKGTSLRWVMRRRSLTSRIGLLGCLASVLVANPGVTAAVQPQPVSISAHSVRGCPAADSCTFVASGAIDDSGSVSANSVKVHALPAPVLTFVQYVLTFAGQDGSLTIRLETIIRPTDVPWLAHEEGRWVVVSGTGAYVGLAGEGRESGTRNYANQSLDVVYEGQLH